MANPFFNAEYYLANNPDLYLNGVTLETAEAHYMQYGAQEAASSAPGRDGKPNPWFNAKFYLMNNPDLVAAGLTAADALNHYAAYGVNEGRDPSATLKVADFTAKDYAVKNKDVAAALGITDTSNLTPEQTNQLLSHFLAYGYLEERGDSGLNVSLPVINVVANTVTFGTNGNDTFAWNDTVASATVNGLGGTDTLRAELAADASITLNSVEKIAVAGSAGVELTVVGSGVESVSVANAANTFGYKGAKVNSFDLSGTGAVLASFIPSTVSGSADSLNVNVAAATLATLTVNGIETVNVNLVADDAAAGLTLAANSAQGESLTVTVAGGKANAADVVAINSVVTLDSTTSPNLVNVTLDGSAGVGDQALSVGATLQLVNATVIGGSGDDTLVTVTAKDHTATLNGGAGVDTLVASAGQDIMTGGAGKDFFQFDVASALAVITGTTTLTISATDTITDFSTGDTVTLSATTMQANGVIAGLGDVDGGVLAFATGTGNLTLTEVATILNANLADDSSVVFTHGSDTYYYATDAGAATGIEGDAIIKLAGVTDVTKLTVADGSVVGA